LDRIDRRRLGRRRYRIYRLAPISPAPPGIWSTIPMPIATVDAGTTTYTDTTVTNGTPYTYYVRAFDDDTNVGPRSAVTATPGLVLEAPSRSTADRSTRRAPW